MNTDLISAGIIAAIAMIFLFFKLDIRKVLGYDAFIDIAFTTLLAYLFAGTFSGMVAALIGGALLSVFLLIAKKVLGYKRLVFENRRLIWKYYY